MYDHHHSRQWNDLVEKKAVELDQEMKIEENQKLSEKKAKDKAMRNAAIARAEKFRLAQKKKAEEEEARKHPK